MTEKVLSQLPAFCLDDDWKKQPVIIYLEPAANKNVFSFVESMSATALDISNSKHNKEGCRELSEAVFTTLCDEVSLQVNIY